MIHLFEASIVDGIRVLAVGRPNARALAWTRAATLLALGCACGVPASAATQPPDSATFQRRAPTLLSGRPLFFEANHGQADAAIHFAARNRDGFFCLSPGEATVTLRKVGSAASAAIAGPQRRSRNRNVQTSTIRFQFAGARPQARMRASGELPGKVNYFVGSDPAKWRTNVPTFTQVQVEDIYPGIKLLYYGNQQQLEYDFEVAPGADPGLIALRITGAEELAIDARGDLVLGLGGQELRQQKPIVYQIDRGQRKEIAGGYQLKNENTVAFRIGPYDHRLPLIIDPVLSYSTFLGGEGTDVGRAIALDSSGNIYVAGDTLSGQLATPGAYQTVYAGGYQGAGGDAFVAKFDNTGSTLLYLTYLGGNGDESATSIALDPEGNAYVTGVTDSTNFPIASLTISNRISGKAEFYFGLHPYDAFVAKLNMDGSQLIYSTYLGGKGQDEGLGIAVDPNTFCAFVTGFTESTDFPDTVGALQPDLAGKSDAFVTKIASNGTYFVYSTYLGGTNADHGKSIAVDGLGRAYVTGYTFSTNFPISAGAFQTNRPLSGLPSQAFVTILESDGTAIAQSTYLGGAGNAAASSVALDSAGNAYVTGSEAGTGFPITPGNIDPGGVFKSTDAAASWAASNLGLLHNQVHAIAVDPANPSNIYIGTGRGIARSANGGGSWQISLDTFEQFLSFAIDPTAPGTIYAGGNEVLKSSDFGATWAPSSAGLPVPASGASTNQPAMVVNKLVIDPLSPATIYAATAVGVFKSLNGAALWHRLSGLASVNVRDLVLDPSTNTTLYAATGVGVFRSLNAGASWVAFNQGLTNAFANALVIAPNSPSIIYVGLDDGTIFKRAATDTNWTLIETGLNPTNNPVTVLAIDPAASTTLYAGTRHGLFKSVDAGTNWNVATNGLPGLPISALAIDPASPSTLYLGAFNSFAGTDAFLTKLSPNLDSVIYSVVFGGDGVDQGLGVAVDPAGNAFVVGATTSANFPTSQPLGYPSSFNSGLNDVFLTAVNANGSDFLYSTYLGGRQDDFGTGIAVDSSDNAYIVGQTFSPDFPAVASLQPHLRGTSDGFVARIQFSGSPVNVTFQTTPPGLSIYVDGTSNATPVTFTWLAGSAHIISAPPVGAGTNVQYAWTSWSDGGTVTHQILATNDTTITANFLLQYFLWMSATNINVSSTNLTVNPTNIGALSPPSGWYYAGTNLSISVIPPAGDTFTGWAGSGSGSYSGPDNPAAIVMDGPITETALLTGPLTNRLTVVIHGSGTVMPNYNGKALQLSNTYSMTARPSPGNVFSNWTGDGVSTASPTVSFVMHNGLVLEATFVPTPFGPAKGSYAGLFYDTNAVAPQSSGFLSATVSAQGAFTAKLQLKGKTISLSGQFDSAGVFIGVVARLGVPTLSVLLRVDLAGGNVLTGEISAPTWTAELVANRAVYSRTNPAPEGGRKYTLLFPGGPNSYAQPGGDSFGVAAVDSSGNVAFSGSLADGSRIAQRTFLSGQGQWPFYASSRAGSAAIIGWLTFADDPATDISGPVNWSKLGLPVTNNYPGGFSIDTQALGSLYSFTNGVPVLSLASGQGQLILENGNLSQNLANQVAIDSRNRVSNLSGSPLSLVILTSSGLFQGRIVDPATGRSIPFNGAVLQKQNRGAGFFLNGRQSGRVLLQP